MAAIGEVMEGEREIRIPGRGRVRVYPDAAAAARAGAERFAEAARAAVEARGVFRAALAGGST
ncbi:MAG TPA: hypothetical protein VHG28_05960, partial [Longimicrobiaceae bacterium]|nr:hypothetical protein [Longimicrobiaceae bacterium]